VIAGDTPWQLVEARAAVTPDALFAVDAVPRNAAGKIQQQALRERYS